MMNRTVTGKDINEVNKTNSRQSSTFLAKSIETGNKAVDALDSLQRKIDCSKPGENGTMAYDREELIKSYIELEDMVKAALVDMNANAIRGSDIVTPFEVAFGCCEELVRCQGEGDVPIGKGDLYMGYLISLVAVIRSSREGTGETELFRKLLLDLYGRNRRLGKLVLSEGLRPGTGGGSWKDLKRLWDIAGPKLKEDIVELFIYQLKYDNSESTRTLRKGEKYNLSLAAKWVPKPGSRVTSKTRNLILSSLTYKIASRLFGTGCDSAGVYPDPVKFPNFCLKEFRKMISPLNKLLGTVEVDMCDQNFRGIDYKSVPACARTKYGKAFRNVALDGNTIRSELEDRKLGAIENKKCIEDAAQTGNGLKASNAGALAIVMDAFKLLSHHVTSPSNDEKQDLQARWNVLTREFKEKCGSSISKMGKVVSMCDTSGSMTWEGGLPIRAALTLSLLVAGLPGPFKNRFMTFESNPRWHTLPQGDPTKDDFWIQFKSAANAKSGGSTNFGAALDLLLEALVSATVSQSECPDVLFIFSDMQVDEANNHSSETMVENLRSKFQDNGYNAPKIVLWNLRSTNTTPVTTHQEGVISLSGFSENMLRMFFDGTIMDFTPWFATESIITKSWTKNIRDGVSRVLHCDGSDVPGPWEHFWSEEDPRWGSKLTDQKESNEDSILPPPPPISTSIGKEVPNDSLEPLERRKTRELRLVDGKMVEIYRSNRLELDPDEAIKRWNSSDIPERYEIVDEIEYPIYKKPKEMVNKSDILDALDGLELSKDVVEAIKTKMNSTLLSSRVLRESGVGASEM